MNIKDKIPAFIIIFFVILIIVSSVYLNTKDYQNKLVFANDLVNNQLKPGITLTEKINIISNSCDITFGKDSQYSTCTRDLYELHK